MGDVVTHLDWFDNFSVSPIQPPTGEDIMAGIRRFTEPTHTVVAGAGNADRIRDVVDGAEGLRVEVVENEWLPLGTAIVIDRHAMRDAMRIPLRPWPGSPAWMARHVVANGGAVKLTFDEPAEEVAVDDEGVQ